MTPIIAIDPGASGGIAYRNSEGITTAFPMPDTQGDILDHLLMLLAAGRGAEAVVERIVGFFAGSNLPGSTMFTLGDNFGFIKGVLQGHSVPIELVLPKTWQSGLHLGKREGQDAKCKREWKNKLKAEAQRRHPHLKVTLSTADALLILNYKMETAGR